MESPAGYEASELVKFALAQTVKRCLDSLWQRRMGSVSFMVCSDSNFFLVNLSQRLNYELGRPQTVVKKPLTISPAHIPVEGSNGLDCDWAVDLPRGECGTDLIGSSARIYD